MHHAYLPEPIAFTADPAARTTCARRGALGARAQETRVNDFHEVRTISAERQPSAPALPAVPEREAVLRLTVPGQRLRQVRLVAGQELVVGRAGAADLTVRDAALSRTHLRLKLGVDGVEVTDLGSTNGSFVRGRIIDRALLHAGERVLFGQSSLEVVRISHAARAA